MTDSKKLDDRVHNHEERDGAKLSATADANAARHATKADVDNASNGKNQNGSAWLDKKTPKPVDYKSIRLVGLGAVAQLSRDERSAEELKPKAQQHITFNELLTLEKEGNLVARHLVNEIDAAYQCGNKEQKKSTLRTIQDSADKLFERGPYAEAPSVVEQLKTMLGGVLREPAKKPLQGHVETNLTQTFLQAANESIDKQSAEIGPAVVNGVAHAVADVGNTLVFGASAAIDGVKLMGQTFNYDYERAAGKLSADASAEVVLKSEADWIQKYAVPLAHGVEKALEPMTRDVEDIGFSGDYNRLLTDPVNYAGQKFDQFSSQPAPKQVEELTTFGVENALTVGIAKGAAEADKEVTATAIGDTTADAAIAAAQAIEINSKIVNPINRNARNFEKIGQLQELGIENAPLIEDFIEKIDAQLGSSSDFNFKEPAEIEAKPLRDDVRKAKPWYDIEHSRDALRFRTAAENLNDLPKIARALKESGFEVINPDIDKLLEPKWRGWRMAAFDLRMPNGQLIEYQVLPKELLEAGKAEHAIYEEWRGKKAAEMTKEERAAKTAADEAATKLYKSAWKAYLKRTGQNENGIKRVIEETREILEQE